MSATPAPPPVPPPHPPRPGAQPAGCLPFLVFVLAAASGAGFLALRCGCLPKEDAGQTVMEILDSPTPAQMKAHLTRIASSEILQRAVKNLNLTAGDSSSRVQEERADRLRQNLEVSARGPFITITVFETSESPAAMAQGVAAAYEEDLNSQVFDASRRVNQMLTAQITMLVASVEKARLEWMELTRRHNLIPDGRSLPLEATISEIAARLSKAKANVAELEAVGDSLSAKNIEEAAAAALIARPGDSALATALNELRLLKAARPEPDPADPALIEATTKLTEQLNGVKDQNAGARRSYSVQIAGLEKLAKEQELEMFAWNQRRSEMDTAKESYDRQKRLLNTLSEEAMTRKVKESVVLRPVRIIDEARPAEVPDRRIRKFVRFGVSAGAALLAALLLSAVATRLCRRP